MHLQRLSMFERDLDSLRSEMLVVIDGEIISASVTTPPHELNSFNGSTAFVHSIQTQLRRQIEREISKRLFKGFH